HALPRAEVPAAEFASMNWPTTAWEGKAVVHAGQGTRDHLRAAIELLSTGRTVRTVFLHVGWRQVGKEFVYLHAAGAIGPGGAVAGIDVLPPGALAGLELPAPSPADNQAAIRASLGFLDLAPGPLTFPFLAATYRAPLGLCDFSLHACGPTGAF